MWTIGNFLYMFVKRSGELVGILCDSLFLVDKSFYSFLLTLTSKCTFFCMHIYTIPSPILYRFIPLILEVVHTVSFGPT